MFSSWVLVFLVVEMSQKKYPSSSQYSFFFSTDGLEVVRNILIVVFSLSFMHNLLLGFEFTYMSPQTKYTLMTACLAFLTGILLLGALLLCHHMLTQGESVYRSSYKVSWIVFTAYLDILLLFTSGFLSLLQYKQSIDGSGSLITIPKSARESQVMEQLVVSIKVVSFPAGAAMPSSIVMLHCTHMKEDSQKKTTHQSMSCNQGSM
ncbi:hypothetical protein K5549_007854, partial [Capra hircus]